MGDFAKRHELRSHENFMLKVVGCESNITKNPGFHVCLLRICTLHCLNQGTGQISNANLLKDLCGTATGAQANPILKNHYDNFRSWCRLKKIFCSQATFTWSSLSLTAKFASPNLQGKAYNSRVVSAWLSEVWCKAGHLGPPNPKT